MRSLGRLRLSLQLDDFAGGFSFLQQPFVLLHTLKEVLSALGVLDVLNTDVDAFGDDPSADSLVDNHTKSVSCDVVHTASLAVVHFVRHTLLYCTVALQIIVY